MADVYSQSFNGATSSTKITHPHVAAYEVGSGNFTVRFRFKLDAAALFDQELFIIRNTGGSKYMLFRMRSTTNFRIIAGDGVVGPFSDMNFPVASGKWLEVVCKRVGQTMYVYLNGVRNKSFSLSTLAGITDSSTMVVIGDNGLTGKYYTGLMDEYQFWNTDLTDQQIADMYWRRGSLPSTGLILDVGFEDGSGSVATDRSTTANNGTIAGTAAYSTDVMAKPLPPHAFMG